MNQSQVRSAYLHTTSLQIEEVLYGSRSRDKQQTPRRETGLLNVPYCVGMRWRNSPTIRPIRAIHQAGIYLHATTVVSKRVSAVIEIARQTTNSTGREAGLLHVNVEEDE